MVEIDPLFIEILSNPTPTLGRYDLNLLGCVFLCAHPHNPRRIVMEGRIPDKIE